MPTVVIREIGHATASAVRRASASGPDNVLNIVLDSHGGDTGGALRAVAAIQAHPGVTVGRVSRRADSAAALVLSACEVRIAPMSATFQLHTSAASRWALGRLTAAHLRDKARELADGDALCQRMMARNLGCNVAAIEGLEIDGVELSAVAALDLGLLTEIVGERRLTQQAAERRAALAAARVPVVWTVLEMQALRARGWPMGRAIAIAPHRLQEMLQRGARDEIGRA